MNSLMQDIRYAARLLFKSPGFTAIAIVTLALGIGANTAIFSVINAVVLRPLPYPEPDRLAMIWQSYPREGMTEVTASPPNFSDWRQQSESFEEMSAFGYAAFSLTGGDEPERLIGARVTPGFFNVLGVHPAAGISFSAESDGATVESVVVLSHELWQRRFGSDENMLGRKVNFGGIPYTVVGIMPEGFSFPRRAELWVPYVFTPDELAQRGMIYLQVVGRLEPGISIDAAQTEMDAIAARLTMAYPETNTDCGISLVSLHEQAVGAARPALLAAFAATAFTLLLACANLANLLLSRVAVRNREIAVRTALGASRGRLIAQFLTESVLLSVLGGALGVLLAIWGTELLVEISPSRFPRLANVGLDTTVVLFAVGISLGTGVLCGLVPALQGTGARPFESLKGTATKATASRQSLRIRHTLIVAEVALGLVLLAGAGLMIRTVGQLQRVDVGFNPAGALATQVVLPVSEYPTPLQQSDFFARVIENLQTLPGVAAAGGVSTIPMSGGETAFDFTMEGRPAPPPGQELIAGWDTVTPGYFHAMGIPLLRGRTITQRDNASVGSVVVISEAMAKRYWPGEDPVGRHITIGYAEPAVSEIVGIVGNVKHSALSAKAGPRMYVPNRQHPGPYLSLVVRAQRAGTPLAATIRSAVQHVDPNQPTSTVRPLEFYVDRSMAQSRFTMLVLGVFAGLGLVLAAVGIYGVMSYSVNQRTQEIGIRMALGAEARDVLGLVLKQGVYVVLLGIVLGLGGALAVTRLLAGMLYSVAPSDPATLSGVCVLLASVAMLACYIPARRATKVDPVVALGYE